MAIAHKTLTANGMRGYGDTERAAAIDQYTILHLVGDKVGLSDVPRLPGVDRAVADLKELVPHLQRTQRLAGCGHWAQQERPGEVNAALIELLGRL